ncbi:MAG TPA: MopE-related protein, partial [Chryseolinea sp.]|nr:MopE-related protein [Chryseolinea sp.]
MKKQLLKGSICILNILFVLLSFQAKAQNVFSGEGMNWVGQINGYSQPNNLTAGDYRVMQYRKVSTTTANPTDGRGQWATTINVQSSGGNVTPLNMPGGGGVGWLLTSGPNANHYSNKWNFGGVGQAALNAVNTVTRNASTDMGINMSTAGRYTFVFRDNGYTASSSVYIGFTTNDPVAITHDSATQLNVTNAIGTVSATISGTPSSQENFYVRYRTVTNDFATTSNVVQASVSGTTITATIPAQVASTVYYYIFSSTRSLAQITAGAAGDIALEALKYADNSGANYSYVVVAAPGQPSAITGNAVACANSSQTYSVANDPAATSYNWTLPSGWSGTSTTNSINVTAGTVGGTISVTATNNSGTSPTSNLSVAINSGTSITIQPSTSGQTVCAGGSVTPLSVTADGSVLTYQWYSDTNNSNVGGMLIAGATSSSYTPASDPGTLYYYCIVGGACTPTSVTSNVSGLITVNGLPNDNASNSPYSGGWPVSNGGGGFGPWSFSTTGIAGTFQGASDIGAASWGTYANTGGVVRAVRSFVSPLPTGSNVSFAMDNGFIDTGSSVGARLRNASGETLMEFRFVGGGSAYTTVDGSGTGNTGVSYTSTGLSNVTIAYIAADTYSISITKSGVTSVLTGRSFSTVAGGQIPAQIEFFNNNAGNGGAFDAFFNNLSVGYPKIFVHPSTVAQATVCQNGTATVLSVTAFGENLGYQWYGNAANDNTTGSLIPSATSNTYSPPTTATGTTYYYCVVSYAGAGSCVTAVTSNVSGAVTVLANTTYYADTDVDGFGDSSASTQSCTGIPPGYVPDATDCNDALKYYVDADADGFGSSIFSACSGITDHTDCDDNLLTYIDADGDGFGSEDFSACSGILNFADCDDSQLFYVDNDGDGFGNNNNIYSACSGITNHTDCNDNDSSNTNGYTFYADNDHDGYGNAAVSTVACVAPANYVTNNTDCDDTKSTVHPGATEIGYNLIDDDCDGLIDEGFPPKITGTLLCNYTLDTIDTYVYVANVAGATGYRWRVTTLTGPTTDQVQFIDTPLRAMKITQLGTYGFATTYKVEVGVYYSGYLQPYTATNCTVSTPATPTQLTSCAGNAALVLMSDAVYANNVPFAAGYRFL